MLLTLNEDLRRVAHARQESGGAQDFSRQWTATWLRSATEAWRPRTGCRHWTSTAREERVVMIVLGFTITLDLWDFVGLRVIHADSQGGLA